MKNLSLIALMALVSVASVRLYSTSYVDITALVGSTVCTGEGSVCNQEVTLTKTGGGLINAIAASKFSLDTKTAKVDKDLGAIDSDKKADINISVKDDGHTLYSFMPKDGKKTFVAFQSLVPGAGKLGHGRVIVTLYRQVEGQTKDDWQWRGSFSLDRKKITPEEGFVTEEFKVTPDGKFEDPAGSRFAIS